MESMRPKVTSAPALATVFPRGQRKGRERVGEVKRSTRTPPSSIVSDLFSFPSSCLGTHLGAKLCFA